ncbi:hypothetical protein [Flindersiella endophytica]
MAGAPGESSGPDPPATSDALRKAVDAHQGLDRFDVERDSHI